MWGGEGPLISYCVGGEGPLIGGRGTSDRLLCGVEGPLVGYCVG